ncbi:hypothetical protein Syun_031091 [Stephania yunnanensis]|uniref:Uncharacterized protein n=1 Tax=Stephania yunnanensis TaxID=152371 RepID=A0AAP0HCT6_9MAGN
MTTSDVHTTVHPKRVTLDPAFDVPPSLRNSYQSSMDSFSPSTSFFFRIQIWSSNKEIRSFHTNHLLERLTLKKIYSLAYSYRSHLNEQDGGAQMDDAISQQFPSNMTMHGQVRVPLVRIQSRLPAGRAKRKTTIIPEPALHAGGWTIKGKT